MNHPVFLSKQRMERRFENRSQAGKLLAKALIAYKNAPDTLILALPRGGVPIAYEIGKILSLPFDIFLVRKLGVPDQPELAMGALSETGFISVNQELAKALHITPETINRIRLNEEKEIQRRIIQYRKGEKLPNLYGRHILLIDDGIATGETMKAAASSLQAMGIKNLTIATPVASKESIETLRSITPDVYTLLIPEVFESVGNWYEAFPQVSDEEVITYFHKNSR